MYESDQAFPGLELSNSKHTDNLGEICPGESSRKDIAKKNFWNEIYFLLSLPLIYLACEIMGKFYGVSVLI